MSPTKNPALERLAGTIAHPRLSPLRFGPVLLRSNGPGIFELLHVDDASTDSARLAPVEVEALADLAANDRLGRFRPNKASPDLVSGWICRPRDAESLSEGLESLLPGGLSDWYASQATDLRVVPFREFADRQTGMFRKIASLSDPEACEVARACCDVRFCLRRRLWPVGEIGVDAAASKSDAPCLEPCALLLELARRAHRMSQEERSTLHLGETDLASIAVALDTAIAHPPSDLREGDLSNPAHPRRLLLLREKLLPWLPEAARGKGE